MSPACHCLHRREQSQLRPSYAPALPPGNLPLGSRAPGGNVMSCRWWSSSNQGIVSSMPVQWPE